MGFVKENKIDLNKPRWRMKHIGFLNASFYKKFRQNHPESTLSNKDIKHVIKQFHVSCIDQITTTRDGLELYGGLGFVFVGACKVKDSKLNVKLSKLIEKEAHFQNWETFQWICKVCYTNYANKYQFKNASCWGFEPSRALSRRTSSEFLKNHKLFVITDNFKKFNKIFKKNNKKFWKENKEVVVQHFREAEEETNKKED